MKVNVRFSYVILSPTIGMFVYGVGITNSLKLMPGMFADVVKNSTFGS